MQARLLDTMTKPAAKAAWWVEHVCRCRGRPWPLLYIIVITIFISIDIFIVLVILIIISGTKALLGSKASQSPHSTRLPTSTFSLSCCWPPSPSLPCPLPSAFEHVDEHMQAPQPAPEQHPRPSFQLNFALEQLVALKNESASFLFVKTT